MTRSPGILHAKRSFRLSSGIQSLLSQRNLPRRNRGTIKRTSTLPRARRRSNRFSGFPRFFASRFRLKRTFRSQFPLDEGGGNAARNRVALHEGSIIESAAYRTLGPSERSRISRGARYATAVRVVARRTPVSRDLSQRRLIITMRRCASVRPASPASSRDRAFRRGKLTQL